MNSIFKAVFLFNRNELFRGLNSLQKFYFGADVKLAVFKENTIFLKNTGTVFQVLQTCKVKPSSFEYVFQVFNLIIL